MTETALEAPKAVPAWVEATSDTVSALGTTWDARLRELLTYLLPAS